jgi:hypothetical protein
VLVLVYNSRTRSRLVWVKNEDFKKNILFCIKTWGLIGHTSFTKYRSPLSITVLDSSLQDASFNL